MACCGGTVDPEERKKNEEVNKLLKTTAKAMASEFKLLLLGAGESGKSTIAKQMKIIHMNGFSEAERMSYKTIIHSNTFGGMRTLVQGAKDLGISLKSKRNKALAKRILEDESYFSGDVTQEIASDLMSLWKDSGIKDAYEKRAAFQLSDSVKYYLDAVDKIAHDDYIPSEQDVLRSRARTTGIIETVFEVEGNTFKMVDVGGQRSERKKWMFCFTDVTAVIFCVALSEYDQKLYEDNKTNRMEESLRLWSEMCNSKWFLNVTMVLFLNKSDIFKDKIQKTSLEVCFPEYTGLPDFELATEFISKKFLEANENNNKKIYVHITTATDTNNIRVVFNAVKQTVLDKNLHASGLKTGGEI